jgi:hypothetical protein
MTPHASRLGRFAALAGAGSALLTVAGYLVIGPNPDSDASTSTVRSYYSTHHAHVYVAGILLFYSAILFAVFGVALWARIRAADLHPVVAGAALAATAIATVSNLNYASAWYVLGDLGGKHTITAAAIQSLHISVSAGDMPSGGGLAILLLAVALAGLLARAFPRWITWSALVLGVLTLTPTPGEVGFLSGFVILLWTLAASIALFLRPAGLARTTAKHSPAAPSSPALTSN